MTVNFKTLWNAYPLSSKEQFFQELGGEWPQLINRPAFENTCALRMSVAMRPSGNNPPPELVREDGNLKDGKNNPLIVRVVTARKWFNQLLGEPIWGESKAIGADISDHIPGQTGILLYIVPGALDASGHVDLWNKTHCRIDCHNDFARNATKVEFWKLD